MTSKILASLSHLEITAARARQLINNQENFIKHLSFAPSRSNFSTCATRQQLQTQTFSSLHANFQIIPNNDLTDPIVSLVSRTGSNIELADLECRLSSTGPLLFNLSWLRDSCHCDKCTHKYSRQRLFTPKDFRKRLFAAVDVQLIDDSATIPTDQVPTSLSGDRYLKLSWADGHESFYSVEWLQAIHMLYKTPHIQVGSRPIGQFLLPSDDFYSPKPAKQSQTDFWSVSDLNSKLVPVDYRDLVDGFEFHDDEPTFINANRVADMTKKRFESMLNLTKQLTTLGLAKIINVPLERNQVLRVARSLAYERPTGYGTVFDVVVEPSEEINLAYSAQEFDLHSDLTYREKSPGVQLLHCIQDSVDGGLSYFSDGFNAAHQLHRESPELFEVLVQFPATFVVRDPYRDIKFRRQKPILTLDQRGKLSEIHYSPFMLPAVGHLSDLKWFYVALDRYTQILQAKDNKLITKMEPGNLFIFNNRRVLHGRSSYDPTTSSRFLQGCYMDWDEIECLHEKLLA